VFARRFRPCDSPTKVNYGLNDFGRSLRAQRPAVKKMSSIIGNIVTLVFRDTPLMKP
jgi:hypothetical protein